MTCPRLHLTRAEMEVNLGLRTPAALPQNHGPRLLSSGTDRPTVRDSRLLETLHAGAQILSKQVHPVPVLSYDRWVELQNHIAAGDP